MIWEAAVLKDFKTFVLRGNVVDLAVGIVSGAARPFSPARRTPADPR